jgi:hypothetical protein
MPHWAWVALVFGGIVALFAFLLRVGGSEPREGQDRWDTPGNEHHHGDDGGHH